MRLKGIFDLAMTSFEPLWRLAPLVSGRKA